MGSYSHNDAVKSWEVRSQKDYNLRQSGMMVRFMEEGMLDGDILKGVDPGVIKVSPYPCQYMLVVRGKQCPAMLMVVDPLKAKITERAPFSTWRRMDRAFVADLHFQEHGWLKDGLEKERSSLNLSVWYPHREWVRNL